MLELFGNAIMAILGGGATGLIGSVISTWGELKKIKEENRHRETMADKDLAIAKAEVEGKIQVARTEADAAVAVADADLQAKSYEHDRATYSTGAISGLRGWWGQCARFLLVFVDISRGLIRPLETIYFTGLATYLTLVAGEVLRAQGQEDMKMFAAAIVPQIFLAILYITTTIIFWWFGARQKIFK